jgi:hypothetical protein
MIEDGTIAIDGPIDRFGDILDKAENNGNFYCDKAPGTSFILMPILWLHHQIFGAPGLSEAVRIGRFWMAGVPTLLLFFMLLYLLESHLIDRKLRLLLLIGYGLGTLATTYGNLLYGHQLSAALIFGCFMLIRKTSKETAFWQAALLGFLASCAIIVEYQNVLFLLPLGIWYLIRTRKQLLLTGITLLAMAPMGLMVADYHQAAFGSPFMTGYSFVASDFADIHKQGILGIALPSIDKLNLNLLSARKGLFFFSPFLIFALISYIKLICGALKSRHFTEKQVEILLSLLMFSLYTFFVCSMVYPDGGWTVSQRHLTPIVPWLILPVGLAIQQHPFLRPVCLGMIGVSILLTTISSIVWPHFQEEITNPFFQLAWPLFWSGWVPPSSFGLLGISSQTAVFGMGCILLILAILDIMLTFSFWKRAPNMLIMSATVACCIIGMKDLGEDIDVTPYRYYVESVYFLDPLAHPLPYEPPLLFDSEVLD